ncbi:MAG: roadblock/LC7 domain-containing protein [Planctomycetota bacterium]
MKDLLEQINDIPGVLGSMVITRDGILAVACMGQDLREDAVAALSSSIAMTLRRSLEPTSLANDPSEILLTASRGRLLYLDLGDAYLVVVTRPNLRLDTDMVEIRGVAKKIRDRCVMKLAP